MATTKLKASLGVNATGTPSSTTFLRGDNTWNTPAAGSFVFLGETTASNVSSVSIDGYFTSSYDIYKIFVDGLYGSSNDQGVRITVNKSGTEQTAGDYSGSLFYMIATGSNVGSTSYDANMAHTYWFGAYSNSSTSYVTTSFDLTLYNPLGTDNHKVMTFISNNNTGDLTRQIVAIGSGLHRVQSAISGIRFKMGSGNIYARKIRIYGVKNT